MPSLTQLRYIVALHRTGHFGKAAVECHVSQPTLSGQIARAEDELGVTLFDRRTKPVVATPPGLALVGLAQEVLMSHERLVAAAKGSLQLSGPFSLGVIPTLAPYVLPWFLGPFSERCPEVELTVLERPTESILHELHGSRMDAGVLATPLGESSLANRVVFYDPFYVYAHPDSPLLAHDEVSTHDLDSDGLWLLEDGHCFRNQVVHLCGVERRKLLSSVHFEAGSFETLRALIERYGGFTLVPESFARLLPRELRLTRIRPFTAPVPTREVGLVAHRSHWRTGILEAIAEVMREHAPRSLPRDLVGTVLPIQ